MKKKRVEKLITAVTAGLLAVMVIAAGPTVFEGITGNSTGYIAWGNSTGFIADGNSTGYSVSILNASVTGISDKTYTGKAITQKLTVKDNSRTLTEGTDYSVSYNNNTNAGTATIKVTGKGIYTGTKTLTFKIKKAANPMEVTTRKATVKAKKLQKKKQKIAAKKIFTIKNAQGAVTFKKKSGIKKITISKTGKVTVKKGLKKGTYKLKVDVTAAGTGNYLPVTKTVQVKIKVK